MIEAPRVDAISTSGAGDSMVAAMALTLAAELPLIDVGRRRASAYAERQVQLPRVTLNRSA